MPAGGASSTRWRARRSFHRRASGEHPAAARRRLRLGRRGDDEHVAAPETPSRVPRQVDGWATPRAGAWVDRLADGGSSTSGAGAGAGRRRRWRGVSAAAPSFARIRTTRAPPVAGISGVAGAARGGREHGRAARAASHSPSGRGGGERVPAHRPVSDFGRAHAARFGPDDAVTAARLMEDHAAAFPPLKVHHYRGPRGGGRCASARTHEACHLLEQRDAARATGWRKRRRHVARCARSVPPRGGDAARGPNRERRVQVGFGRDREGVARNAGTTADRPAPVPVVATANPWVTAARPRVRANAASHLRSVWNTWTA